MIGWYREGEKIMQQIKIFEANGNNEADVNAWLKDNPAVKVNHVTMVPMFDRYAQGRGDICSQWTATIVVYSGELAKKIEPPAKPTGKGGKE